jgi:hypothetical protein
MNFLSDKRFWYAVAAVIVVVILYVVLRPSNLTEAPLAPATTSSPAATPQSSPTPAPK